jgi:hypothetical protein
MVHDGAVCHVIGVTSSPSKEADDVRGITVGRIVCLLYTRHLVACCSMLASPCRPDQ